MQERVLLDCAPKLISLPKNDSERERSIHSNTVSETSAHRMYAGSKAELQVAKELLVRQRFSGSKQKNEPHAQFHSSVEGLLRFFHP